MSKTLNTSISKVARFWDWRLPPADRASSEVRTYRLSPEELEKYRKGGEKKVEEAKNCQAEKERSLKQILEEDFGRSCKAVRMKAEKLGLLKRPPKNRAESLCFNCVNARADRCPWIGEKKKIWTKAIESTFRADSVRNRKITIYIVTNCPNYVREAMRA